MMQLNRSTPWLTSHRIVTLSNFASHLGMVRSKPEASGVEMKRRPRR